MEGTSELKSLLAQEGLLGGVAPIGNAPLMGILAPLLSDSSEIPPDQPEHHIWFRGLRVNPNSPSHNLLLAMRDYFTRDTAGKRRPTDLAVLEEHWTYALLNLAVATLQRKWVLVCLRPKDYASDFWLQHYGLKYRATRAIFSYLEKEGLVIKKKGAKFEGAPTRTRVFPSVELQELLLSIMLEAEEAIEPPYLVIRCPDGGWEDVIDSLSADHDDPRRMGKINEFLKGHRWACKGPVRLVYKHDPFTGGRLITPFQNLPDRRARIRINTLIDGDPICEVDFNANHLRLNLAVFGRQDAGDTPYEDICELAGGVDRALAKSFITKAMGADDEQRAFNACKSDGMTLRQFESLRDATLRRFGKIRLFTGFGVNAQSLEGQILMDVMAAGADCGKVALPVHDAVAVKASDADWATEQMLEAWPRVVGGGTGKARARIKVDRA